MGRIKNKELYPDDPLVTVDDYLIGSDADNQGKTQNYPIRSVLALIDDLSIVTVGNEKSTGIATGYDVIDEGKPIVAEYGKLAFEHNTQHDVTLLKLVGGAGKPLINMTLRGNGKVANPDEAFDKWYYTTDVAVVGDVAIAEVSVPKLEVTLDSIDGLIDPVLIVKRYRSDKYKGLNETKDSKNYRRAGFREEQQMLGTTLRPNRIPITGLTTMVDLECHKYFTLKKNLKPLPIQPVYVIAKTRGMKGKSSNFGLGLNTYGVDKQYISLHIEAKLTPAGEYVQVSNSEVVNLAIRKDTNDDYIFRIRYDFINETRRLY